MFRFRGRFVHSIDAKGRVSIPSGYRLELQEHSERAPILTNTDQCLVLYPFEDWCAFEEDLEQLSPVDPDVQSFRRLMVSGPQTFFPFGD